MGGYKRNEKLSQFDFMIAGGGSGMITRALCQPLDVLKIRFQLQVEPISRKSISKYQSIPQAVNVVLHEEGLKAFWKGHIPAQWLSIIYGTVQFWAFETLSKKVNKWNFSSNISPVVNFSCGAISGVSATVASFPFDVIRTRLVAQSEQQKVYKGIVDSAREILRKEGTRVLFRGLWPTMVQVGPHAGAQFMCYKLFEELYARLAKSDGTTLSSSLIAGSLAGFFAKTLIYPLDLAKKRMQIQGFEEGRKSFGKSFKCSGLNDCLVKIYRFEGVLGYYKGLSPSLIKAVVTSALHFSSYEMICKFLVFSKG
ncbi:unnamed protein product [Phaedon cochleariae]|uniref:Mitochondrial thiamine pyrophosphate carrier n=1 Tax=Phaedon cochleariae TaxID=80249 RepID=A0A9N9SHQ4_PHACE|nr:unnamed protein product [Phaedon cochleariae]